MSLTALNHFDHAAIMLPNTDAGSAEGIALQADIDVYEPQFLELFLGYATKKQFLEGLNSDDAACIALRDGAEYTDTNGVLQYWAGFTTKGLNPIANYVYWFVRSDSASQTFSIGETTASVENGARTSPRQKMVHAWNTMVYLNLKLHAYLYANQADFPEYIGLTYPPFMQASYTNAVISMGIDRSTLLKQQSLFKKINILGI